MARPQRGKLPPGRIWQGLRSGWMDGRPHPSKNARHEIGGFTTGAWEDDVLTAYTTHMKAGVLRRNGIPMSDQATMKLRLFRHDDLLTVTHALKIRSTSPSLFT